MKPYRISLHATVLLEVDVEADSLEDARAQVEAWNGPKIVEEVETGSVQDLCHHTILAIEELDDERRRDAAQVP